MTGGDRPTSCEHGAGSILWVDHVLDGDCWCIDAYNQLIPIDYCPWCGTKLDAEGTDPDRRLQLQLDLDRVRRERGIRAADPDGPK